MKSKTLKQFKKTLQQCNDAMTAIKKTFQIKTRHNPYLGTTTTDNMAKQLEEKAAAPSTKINNFVAVAQDKTSEPNAIKIARKEAIRLCDEFIQTLIWALDNYDAKQHARLDSLLNQFVALAADMTATLNLALKPTPKTDTARRLSRRTSSFNVAVTKLNSRSSQASKSTSSETSTISKIDTLDNIEWIGFDYVAFNESALGKNSKVETQTPNNDDHLDLGDSDWNSSGTMVIVESSQPEASSEEDELNSDLEPWDTSGTMVIVEPAQPEASSKEDELENPKEEESPKTNNTSPADVFNAIQTFISTFDQNNKPTGVQKIEKAIQASPEREDAKLLQAIQTIVTERQTGWVFFKSLFVRDDDTNRFYEELQKIDLNNETSLENFTTFVENYKPNKVTASVIHTKVLL